VGASSFEGSGGRGGRIPKNLVIPTGKCGENAQDEVVSTITSTGSEVENRRMLEESGRRSAERRDR